MKKEELLKMVITSLKEENDEWEILKKNDWSGKYENKKKGIVIFMGFFTFKVHYQNQTFKFGFIATMFKVDHLLPSRPDPNISEFDMMSQDKYYFPDMP